MKQKIPLSSSWKMIKVSKKSGGQGTISLVQNIHTPTLKGALKAIHPEQQKRKNKRERMCTEITSLKKIAERGIPKIFEDNAEDVKNFNIPLYFVSEWVDGKTLHEIYLQKPTPLDEATRITRELCLIIDRCHQEHILHRDIKPQNILISSKGETYLVDFGLAWIKPMTDADGDFTSFPHEEISNFFLRLPEFITGFEKHNEVSDITYLVGILFFLLTGQYPKSLIDGDGNPPHETLKQHFSNELVSDQRWNTLKRIFDIGFQSSIKHRFSSAIDLIKMLDEINHVEENHEQKAENNSQVQKLQELLNSSTLKTKENIFKTFTEINNRLQQKLSALGDSMNLKGGINTPQGDNYRGFNIYFSNPNFSNEQIHLNHTLEFADNNGTKVRATYSIDKGDPQFYYMGYSTDTEALINATDNISDEIFIKVAEAYNYKTKKAPPLF